MEDDEYQDVKKLKKQIQMMRQELESQMSDEEEGENSESDTTGKDTPPAVEELQEIPVVTVSPASKTKVEQIYETKKSADTSQGEQLKFDVCRLNV